MHYYDHKRISPSHNDNVVEKCFFPIHSFVVQTANFLTSTRLSRLQSLIPLNNVNTLFAGKNI